ncbi:hypothetical protein ACJIZ3_003683 [Penstemon smallii]|uniref:Uncharacterized protein n=1 Tax=Penstemon smallii TaxID=265156 RepID=A0ABD3UD07_9LAMI
MVVESLKQYIEMRNNINEIKNIFHYCICTN